MNTALNIQQLVPAWQSLQSIIPVAHIDSEEEYAQTTALLNSLLDVVRDDAQHPLYSLLSVIGDLIEAYEIDHEPK
jgi:HTH-type transcriptional regulator/antitoxin HigA